MSVKTKSKGQTRTLVEKEDLSFLNASAKTITSANAKVIFNVVNYLQCGNLGIVTYLFHTNASVSQGEEMIALPMASTWGNYYVPLFSEAKFYNAIISGSTLSASENIPASTYLRGLFVYPIVR